MQNDASLAETFMQIYASLAKEIKAVMPSYFDALDSDEMHVAKQHAGDWAQVADALYKYLHHHHKHFRAKRESELSGRQPVILFSEKEAPREHELKAHRSLLRSCQAHDVGKAAG